MTEKTFKLSQPIVTQGETGTVTLTEITLRPPKAREVFDFGIPFNDNDMITGPVLREWIMRLSGQDGSVVDDMGLAETMDIARWIGGFFKAAGTDAKN